MKEGLIKDTYELIIKEIQSILAVTYILMVGIGMMFNYQKYSEFGINIFQYADIFDFLIAPFQDYRIMLFSVGTILFTFFVLKLDTWWMKKHRKSYSFMMFGMDKKNWFNLYRTIMFPLVFLLYLWGVSDIYGKETFRNIEQQKEVEIIYTDKTIDKGILIGKTKEVLFFKMESSIKIIPISAVVKAIEIK